MPSGRPDTVEKGIDIKEIVPGRQVNGLFCVASKSLRHTKTNAPFLSLTLSDSSGTIEARIWDRAEEFNVMFDQGDIIQVHADATEFNNRCQLKINRVHVLREDEIDPSLFLPVATIDREGAWNRCSRAIKSIKTPELRRVMDEMFSDSWVREKFREAPAAKRMHHACIGGLLEHSVSLLRLTDLLCKVYPHLNRDLLTAACLCHDIGKIREFSWYTAKGWDASTPPTSSPGSIAGVTPRASSTSTSRFTPAWKRFWRRMAG